MNQKLKLLIIENDNDKVKSIENHLGKEFFEIDGVNSLKDGLDKLLIENSSMPICKYDVIVLNINGNFPLQEIIQFFREIRAKELDKPNCAFILFKNPQEEVNVVNQILSGKSFHIINTDDYSNDLYKLEQAILTTVPRAFHYYRKKIEICISGIEEKKTAVDNLMKIIDGIDKETK
ncbi:MAG: hypothetical protein MUF15_24015, partial [Acidobacteria bacterium]|nr:hypothetical protein [Acidobacteriota bacterium]